MSRYTDWLKEKVICLHCQKIITRGHIEAHKKTLVHLNNIKNNVEPLTGSNYSTLNFSINDDNCPNQEQEQH